jgi:predicted DsbA family dithiol-disulfide isomerase
MKVEIWSDIRCPFCYIGKRKFEMALAGFPHRDRVEVVWHSFELDPNLRTMPGKSMHDYLAEIKGMPRERSVQMHDHVSRSAKEVGLVYNFDQAVVANSLKAHRLVHLAKTHGLADEAEERLFRAHFTEGLNTDDPDTLVRLGSEIGLSAAEVREMFSGDAFTREVREDEAEAHTIGIQGVPFFLINRKYAVSGAQSPTSFLKGLEKAWDEYEKELTK